VTRAEAGQQKRLLLLDRAAGWEATEQLPLDLGPRYFSVSAVSQAAEAALAEGSAADGAVALDGAEVSAAEGLNSSEEEAEAAVAAAAEAAAAEFALLLPEGLRPGDRLLLTLPAAAAKQHQKRLKKLEKAGTWGNQKRRVGQTVACRTAVCKPN